MGFIEDIEDGEKSFQITRWLNRLDEVARSYEAKWGVGFLTLNASVDFKEKWDRQNKKLGDAIQNQQVALVAELVEGTIRAWKALEQNVIDQGITPKNKDFWEGRSTNGYVIRVCKTLSDARACSQKDIPVFSIEEIANIIEARMKTVGEIKKIFPESKLTKLDDFDFKTGDSVEF